MERNLKFAQDGCKPIFLVWNHPELDHLRGLLFPVEHLRAVEVLLLLIAQFPIGVDVDLQEYEVAGLRLLQVHLGTVVLAAYRVYDLLYLPRQKFVAHILHQDAYYLLLCIAQSYGFYYAALVDLVLVDIRGTRLGFANLSQSLIAVLVMGRRSQKVNGSFYYEQGVLTAIH